VQDDKIIALYWERDEQAITETQNKYGAYLLSIAFQILSNREDAKECENDTYLAAWGTMPPQKPNRLSAFLGKITRNLSLKKLRGRLAAKRSGNEALLSLDELADCIPDAHSFQESLEAEELASLLSTFLRGLPETERNVFVCRYWYCDSIAQIAQQFGFGESKVKMMLKRTRQKLSDYLQKEGVLI